MSKKKSQTEGYYDLIRGRTGRIRDMQFQDGSPAEDGSPAGMEKRLRLELKVYGFAAVKAIAQLRGGEHGTMECPMCGEDLSWSLSPTNGHCAATCGRKGCLQMKE